VPQRRAIPGLKTRTPLGDDAEYRLALHELHGLGEVALGTPKTRGLQDLVDCILDYEVVRGLSGVGDAVAEGSGMARWAADLPTSAETLREHLDFAERPHMPEVDEMWRVAQVKGEAATDQAWKDFYFQRATKICGRTHAA
jgi:hypothetical protein